ncbi:MAG: GYD domain-containing protein [Chloroflexota bacterium]|nr:GYD domain-containing protein [Chloroflexota bacterium]
MAKYVGLINWTDQGIHRATESVQRVEQSRAAFESVGVRIETVVWTQGRYDIVAIFEAPNDEAMAAAMLRLGVAGNVRSETLRAFTAEEMSGIVRQLG